jgi:glycosyltransferase involved in cell wall biosynthesis
MKAIVVHNRYRLRGGEDEAFETELRLLQRNGVQVVPVVTRSPANPGEFQKVALAGAAIWSGRFKRSFGRLLARVRPDVVHVHNFFPVVSPAVFYACRDQGIPVVQTLHNYRLLCPAATLHRNGTACEECVVHGLWRSIWHGCYHGSRLESTGVALMLGAHRAAGTWQRAIDRFIALNEFGRRRFIAGGIPADRIVVKPNCVDPDPGPGDHRGGFALYVGRLSQEKGVETLLAAWRGMPGGIPLRIVGEGPMRGMVLQALRSLESVRYDGGLPRRAVLALMRDARVLIFPSSWYEPFGLVLLEALACGLPVIASRIGGIPEIIEDHRTGRLFPPGDSAALREEVVRLWHQPDLLEGMARECREVFDSKYDAEQNARMLIEIYRQARSGSRREPVIPDGQRGVEPSMEGPLARAGGALPPLTAHQKQASVDQEISAE